MKRGSCSLIFVFGYLMVILQADELALNNGQILSGIVLKTDGKSVTFRMQIDEGQAEVPYPLAMIKTLRLVNDAETEALLKSSQTADLPKLQQLWEKRLPYLGMAESNSGEVGLCYGKLLLARKTKKAAAAAVIIAQLVEKGDWQDSRKNEASRLRLSALASAGKSDQAVAEAEKFQNISTEDESGLAMVRVQARMVQAEVASNRWLALEKEWPKWKMMPEKRRERSLLLNQALDGFLFPVVFHSDQTRLCAEGLYRAAEIHLKLGETESARLYAREIIERYPEPEFKEKAEKMIKETKPVPGKEST